jgi:hypothetical protein
VSSAIFLLDDCLFTEDDFAASQIMDQTLDDQKGMTESVNGQLDEDPPVNGRSSSQYCAQQDMEV